MKKASISQLKNHLSAFLDTVRGGDAVLITDRGRPVAKLVAVSDSAPDDADGRLERLERAGVLVRGQPRGAGPAARPRPLKPRRRGASLLKALLAERDEGR